MRARGAGERVSKVEHIVGFHAERVSPVRILEIMLLLEGSDEPVLLLLS